MEVLGQLLAAHVVVQLLPDARCAAQFAAHALVAVPGAVAGAAILEGEASFEGEWDDSRELILARDDNSAGQPRWREISSGTHVLTLPLGTIHHRHERLYLLTEDPREIEPYVPFLGNMAAAIALTLDNRRNRMELELANAKLADSRGEYQQLFSTMMNGFAIHEIITDESGKPIDYRFLEVNEAFTRLTGMTRERLIGHTAREVIPGLEPSWVETAGKVALRGSQVQIEGYSAPLDRHFDVVVYSPAPRKFATIFADITERKRAESERQRLIDQLQRVASTLQENLIHPLPAIEGLELGRVSSTAYLPDLVGGDFSDVFIIDPSSVAILIGDVAGKGIKAAGLTETVHTAVASYALIDTSPGFILRKTNELLLRIVESDEQFVTAFLLVLDLRSGTASYASAGHPAPVHLSGGSARLLDPEFGLPLGMFVQHYPVCQTVLAPGDCLVFYTDGITEARRNGELLGDQRLLSIVRGLDGNHPEQIAEGVRSAAIQFTSELKDDLQVLALRLTHLERTESPTSAETVKSYAEASARRLREPHLSSTRSDHHSLDPTW